MILLFIIIPMQVNVKYQSNNSYIFTLNYMNENQTPMCPSLNIRVFDLQVKKQTNCTGSIRSTKLSDIDCVTFYEPELWLRCFTGRVPMILPQFKQAKSQNSFSEKLSLELLGKAKSHECS